MIRAVNLLFLLSLLPWTFIAFMVLLIVHVPYPPPMSVQVFRALFFSYPIAVILSRFASSQAERRNKRSSMTVTASRCRRRTTRRAARWPEAAGTRRGEAFSTSTRPRSPSTSRSPADYFRSERISESCTGVRS